jgi:hypothetical protein
VQPEREDSFFRTAFAVDKAGCWWEKVRDLRRLVLKYLENRNWRDSRKLQNENQTDRNLYLGRGQHGSIPVRMLLLGEAEN